MAPEALEIHNTFGSLPSTVMHISEGQLGIGGQPFGSHMRMAWYNSSKLLATGGASTDVASGRGKGL
eukprot:9489759-Alexandrium_andersonii.AAC.1